MTQRCSGVGHRVILIVVVFAVVEMSGLRHGVVLGEDGAYVPTVAYVASHSVFCDLVIVMGAFSLIKLVIGFVTSKTSARECVWVE